MFGNHSVLCDSTSSLHYNSMTRVCILKYLLHFTKGKTYIGVLDEELCRLEKISLIELKG